MLLSPASLHVGPQHSINYYVLWSFRNSQIVEIMNITLSRVKVLLPVKHSGRYTQVDLIDSMDDRLEGVKRW